jgi:HK97 family phage major capsid protein
MPRLDIRHSAFIDVNCLAVVGPLSVLLQLAPSRKPYLAAFAAKPVGLRVSVVISRHELTPCSNPAQCLARALASLGYDAHQVRTGVVTPELRAAGESTGSAGGYAVAPEFLASLAVQLQAFGALFRDFTRFETEQGSPLYAPTANFATAGVVQTEDSGPVVANDRVYGQVAFPVTPTIASGMHQVSMQFLQDSGFPVEDVISAFAAESIGRKLAALSVSGTGSGQPFGVIPIATAQGAASLTGR